MTRLRAVAFLFAAMPFTSISVSECFAAPQQKQPNVVLILADDLGWSDTTLFGATRYYKTPHLERLAARGMTFTRAYSSTPLCSPTRACVLTGLSPARHGITSPNCHLPKVLLKASTAATAPPNRQATQPLGATRLDTRHYTLAEMFKDNGYVTGHFGKWHLGAEPYSPLQHGFDVDVPHWHGPGPAGSYVAPWKFPDFDPQTPDEHLEDRMAEEAVAFMEKHRDQPFFLNYWMFSVHAPFDAKRALIQKYRKTADTDDPQHCPVYAAMIESMDDAVGVLLGALDRLKLAENTIIIFASDNGGNMYNQVEGVTVTSNHPLRGGKATMYEGGIRGPAIFVHPGQIEAGSRSEQIIQSSDFYPTLLDILKIKPQADQKFDGVSIRPALQGKPLQRDAIFTYFPHAPPVPQWMPPAVSVHSTQGEAVWKLIRIFHGGQQGKHRYKLYNLTADIGEKTNLAGSHPQMVQKLDAKIEAFLVDTGAARPLQNPAFDPARYRPELEGVGRMKMARKPGSKPAQKPAPRKVRPAVAGWVPGGTCDLAVKNGALMVTSTGGDPYCSFHLPQTIKGEKNLTLQFTLQSTAAGNGSVYWKAPGAPFHRQRSTSFKMQHDNQPHTYKVTFAPAQPVGFLRIDPGAAAGRISIQSVKLTGAGGKVLHEWKF